jgi:hypothetical protein
MDNLKLEPHLQRMVDAGVSGTDILHGELKNLMLMAEQNLTEIATQEEEEDYSSYDEMSDNEEYDRALVPDRELAEDDNLLFYRFTAQGAPFSLPMNDGHEDPHFTHHLSGPKIDPKGGPLGFASFSL